MLLLACNKQSAITLRASGLRPADVAELVAHMYVCMQLSTYRIGKLTGIDRQRVRRLLGQAGVAVKPRGAGRRGSATRDRLHWTS